MTWFSWRGRTALRQTLRRGWSSGILFSFLGLALGASDALETHHVGRMEDKRIRESSGLVASPRYPDVFWTHNDSGNAPILFAIDSRGKALAHFPVDARNVDWEDIASGPDGTLYVADIGNNNGNRQEVSVLVLREPELSRSGEEIKPLRTLRLRYPGKSFDSESLFIHENEGFLIEKKILAENVGLYSFSLQPADSGVQTLTLRSAIPLGTPITGADYDSQSGRLLMVTPTGVYIYQMRIKPAIALEEHVSVPLFLPGIEACCFHSDGVLLSSEAGMLFKVTHATLANAGRGDAVAGR
jgi:hypothetical protein